MTSLQMMRGRRERETLEKNITELKGSLSTLTASRESALADVRNFMKIFISKVPDFDWSPRCGHIQTCQKNLSWRWIGMLRLQKMLVSQLGRTRRNKKPTSLNSVFLFDKLWMGRRAARLSGNLIYLRAQSLTLYNTFVLQVS